MGITRIEIVIIAAIIAAIIAMIAGIPFLAEAGCMERTDGMGFNVKWSFIGGCKIEYEKGKWIPLANYRKQD